MIVVKHPRIEGIKYEVADSDLDRWLSQGWIQTSEPASESAAPEAPAQITVGTETEADPAPRKKV